MRIAAILLMLGTATLAAPQSPRTEFSGPPGSAEPYLAETAAGGLLATWFEPRAGELKALRIAERRNGSWTTPVTVAERP